MDLAFQPQLIIEDLSVDAMKGAGTLVFLFLLFFSSFLRDLSWLSLSWRCQCWIFLS